LGREIISIYIKFTIIISQNKRNHLLFLYAKIHTILCKKIATVNTSLEIDI